MHKQLQDVLECFALAIKIQLAKHDKGSAIQGCRPTGHQGTFHQLCSGHLAILDSIETMEKIHHSCGFVAGFSDFVVFNIMSSEATIRLSQAD